MINISVRTRDHINFRRGFNAHIKPCKTITAWLPEQLFCGQILDDERFLWRIIGWTSKSKKKIYYLPLDIYIKKGTIFIFQLKKSKKKLVDFLMEQLMRFFQ